MTTGSGRVLVAGASGRTGRAVLDALAGSDYTVVAHTRTEAKAGALAATGAREVRVADLTNDGAAARVVDGMDAALCAVGSPSGLGSVVGPFVDEVGVCNLAAAAADADVDHLVLASCHGVDDDGGLSLRELLSSRVRDAKARGEACVRESGVHYTVFRPASLTDGDATGVVVGDPGSGVAGSVSRAALARAMVAALSAPGAENRTVEVAGDGSGDATAIEW